MPCVPIATVIIAMTVLGETPTGTQFAAIMIMAAGMAFSALSRPVARPA
jgi:drug/metabolite transporter (DMT)-like permease